ncbi:MAG: ATP-binding cassette domain-containing protein [Actinomycetota bacterium]
MADERLRITGRLLRGDLDLAVDLDLPRGVIAVIGPNGAGKTSLLRAIAGLDVLGDGEIVLEGALLDRRVDDTFVPPERRNVAVAFQEPRLFPNRTVLGNIAYPLERAGTSKGVAAGEAHDLAVMVGMTSMVQRRPRDLSGGQAQRVNLARAMAQRANTLLLDEPLAAIDESSRDGLRSLIFDSGSERVVWVTHDPTDAERADHVVSISGGRLDQTAP